MSPHLSPPLLSLKTILLEFERKKKQKQGKQVVNLGSYWGRRRGNNALWIRVQQWRSASSCVETGLVPSERIRMPRASGRAGSGFWQGAKERHSREEGRVQWAAWTGNVQWMGVVRMGFADNSPNFPADKAQRRILGQGYVNKHSVALSHLKLR